MSAPNLSSLPIGSVAQVSSEDGKTKYLAHIVGVEADKVIITNIPGLKQLGGDVSYDTLFPESKTFIFRVLGSGIVFGFKSKVITRIQAPTHLLLSAYPVEVQTRNLRKESRQLILAGFLVLILNLLVLKIMQ